MTDTATYGANEASAPAFINGSAADAKAARPAKQTPRSIAAPPPTSGPDAAEPTDLAALWRDSFAGLLQWHEILRQGMADLAREQLNYLGDAAHDYCAAGRLMAGESDPERRAELAWEHVQLRLDRALASSARMIEHLGAPGREILDSCMRGDARRSSRTG